MKSLICLLTLISILGATQQSVFAQSPKTADELRKEMVDGYDRLSRLSNEDWKAAFEIIADELESRELDAKAFRAMANPAGRHQVQGLIKERIDSMSENGIALVYALEHKEYLWLFLTPFGWIWFVVSLDGSAGSSH